MNSLAIPIAALPATSPEMLDKIGQLESVLLGLEAVERPADLDTEHVIHAGMYARTIRMPAGMVLTGALIKRATLVITVGGPATILAGEHWVVIEGHRVIPARANRKQVFISAVKDEHGEWIGAPIIITMLFPTTAKTVEEAELEFTDDADRLLSRRQDANTVLITEE